MKKYANWKFPWHVGYSGYSSAKTVFYQVVAVCECTCFSHASNSIAVCDQCMPWAILFVRFSQWGPKTNFLSMTFAWNVNVDVECTFPQIKLIRSMEMLRRRIYSSERSSALWRRAFWYSRFYNLHSGFTFWPVVFVFVLFLSILVSSKSI